MGKDPAMPFYANDWLSSPRVQGMSPAEELAYFRLCLFCWASGDASIPDDDEQLAAITRMGKGWLKGGSQVVRKCFNHHPTKIGYLTNSTVLRLWNERQEWREKSKMGGQKSGKARSAKRLNNAATCLDDFQWSDGIPITSGSCIYLLIHKGVVVYVGETQDLACRIGGHADKIFDAVQWAVVSEELRLGKELKLIKSLKPKYNTKGGSTVVEPKGNSSSSSSSSSSEKKDTPLPPLPASLCNEPLKTAVEDWLRYKLESGKRYKGIGLKKFFSRVANVAAIHGPQFVVDQMEKASSNTWVGWEHDSDHQARSGSPRKSTLSHL